MTIVDAISGTEYSLAVEGSEGSVEVMVTGNADACYYLGCMDADAATTTPLPQWTTSCMPNLEAKSASTLPAWNTTTDGDCVMDCEEVPRLHGRWCLQLRRLATDDDGSCILYPGLYIDGAADIAPMVTATRL